MCLCICVGEYVCRLVLLYDPVFWTKLIIANNNNNNIIIIIIILNNNNTFELIIPFLFSCK